MSVQVLTTPLHLLGLDLYNRDRASSQDRMSFIRKEYVATAIFRMARALPAFGIGGVVNKQLRVQGKGLIIETYQHNPSRITMPNYLNEAACQSSQEPTQSSEDKKALEYLKNGNGKLIATEINKAGPAMKSWGAMLELFRQYQTRAGVQLWDHTSYASYKCTGPYIAEWHNSGVASWHPSKLGHELRAAHYAYFWLLILQDAVVDLKNNLTGSAAKSISVVTAWVKKHIELERKHIPPKPAYAGAYYTYPDSMQCLTTYEPKHDPDADLRRWVVGGLAGQGTAGGKAWTPKIFEEMTDPGIIAKARSRGYRDFKHMLYGNKNSAPLSIKINIGKAMSGTGFLCQPPGNWGKLPRGFKNFWEVGTEVYLTADTKDPTTEQPFEFSPSGPRTTKLAYTNRRPKDTQTICVDFAPFQFPAGQHILTIVAKAEENIMISTLLLPSK